MPSRSSTKRKPRPSKCAYCKGTGQDPAGFATRICPVCKGTGKVRV